LQPTGFSFGPAYLISSVDESLPPGHPRSIGFMINCFVLRLARQLRGQKRSSSPMHEAPAMNIEIRDAALEARIKKQLRATGSTSVEEVLLRLLETQEEQDRWLFENRETINAKIRRGIEQLNRGQGIPEDRLDAHLTDLKAKPE